MTFDPTKALPTKAAFSLLEEFRAFAFKGNMIDMAIAVVIGGAFGKVIESLVKNVIMQFVTGIVSAFGSGIDDYKSLSFSFLGTPIQYGAFLGELLTFTIVAFSVFILMVKLLGMLAKLKPVAAPAADAPPPKPTKDQELLAEIRDLLKNRKA